MTIHIRDPGSARSTNQPNFRNLRHKGEVLKFLSVDRKLALYCVIALLVIILTAAAVLTG